MNSARAPLRAEHVRGLGAPEARVHRDEHAARRGDRRARRRSTRASSAPRPRPGRPARCPRPSAPGPRRSTIARQRRRTRPGDRRRRRHRRRRSGRAASRTMAGIVGQVTSLRTSTIPRPQRPLKSDPNTSGKPTCKKRIWASHHPMRDLRCIPTTSTTPLTIVDVVDETADTRSFVLEIPPELGRHVRVRRRAVLHVPGHDRRRAGRALLLDVELARHRRPVHHRR